VRARTARPPAEAPPPPRPPVAVKGRGEGLHIVVSPAEPQDVEAALRQQLAQRSAGFFAGAAVVLELPPGPLDLALAARLGEVIAAAGMRLTAVQSRGEATAARSGAPPPPASTPAAPPSGALVVTATLRSGQRVVHDGSVVVLGDVNPGAEVVAGGSVIVWGHLRGYVEAGQAEGAAGSVVCALDLSPTQLRIGAALARAPEEPDRTPEPEVARQVGGQIVVDGWR
jgi:septum site-determining protein MinC